MDKLLTVEHFVELVIALIASSGFWVFVGKWNDRKDFSKQLLLGLAHDRIIYLCLKFIEQGCITQDEYENLYDYLYVPYTKMGGNGTAAKLMDEVKKLPIVKLIPTQKLKEC